MYTTALLLSTLHACQILLQGIMFAFMHKCGFEASPISPLSTSMQFMIGGVTMKRARLNLLLKVLLLQHVSRTTL
jgi:hypothetical protein